MMPSFLLITGAAGSGKTHLLLDKLIEMNGRSDFGEHQKILAITRMHGSRRRLVERVKDKCPNLQLKIETVDSFALSIVNRWRRSIDIGRSVLPSEAANFHEDSVGTRANFEFILRAAVSLLRSQTVASFIANSYPIIVIDEFQDCTGAQLELIKTLYGLVDFIAAGDPFQSLDGNEEAIEWVIELEKQGLATVTRLEGCQRTDKGEILKAAEALLKNQPIGGSGLPYFYAPRYNMAVWGIMFWQPLRGTSALIVSSHSVFDSLGTAYTSQLVKRSTEGKNTPSFLWPMKQKDGVIISKIKADVGNIIMTGETKKENPLTLSIYNQIMLTRECRGFIIDDTVIDYFCNLAYHNLKNFSFKKSKYSTLTIHGAKNNEFDNVYIVWDTFKLVNVENEEKRRLLYNAITRAKNNCSLIVIGKKGDIAKCPVFSLLGKPGDIFPNRKIKKRKA